MIGKSGRRVTEADMKQQTLLAAPPRVINIGIEDFAESLRERDVAVIQIAWAPPAGGDPVLREILEKLGR